MPKALCNQVLIEYETFGKPDNPPVLLIMGLGAQMIVWPERFCQLLAEEGYFVIRFDNRDIGLSSKLSDHPAPKFLSQLMANWFGLRIKAPYDLNTMAQDAVALLDHLGLAKAHIIGASMGGMIAQLMAGLHHDRILSLTSIMSTAHRRSLVMPWNLKLGLQLWRSSQAQENEKLVHKMETVRLISSRTHPPGDQELKRRLSYAMARDSEEQGVRRQLAAIVATKSQKQISRQVNVPTLLIHGTEDRLIPIKFGRKNAQLIQHAEFREIEGMAHDFPRPLVGYLAFLVGKHLSRSSDADS